MESLPDEILINIFYNSEPEEVRNLCLTNPNLSRFCREKSVRIAALSNYYRTVADADIIFLKLLTPLKMDVRNLERLEALLDLEPSWVNAVFKLTIGIRSEYTRPLELANYSPAVILLLLSRGADPLLPALLVYTDRISILELSAVGLSDDKPSEPRNSILSESANYGDPTLHLLCMQNGYILPWSDLDFNKANLEILMTYAAEHPIDIATHTIPGDERAYFPILRLLRSEANKGPINFDFDKNELIDVTVASYRQIQLSSGNDISLNLSSLVAPVSTPFYQLRQLDYLIGPLNPVVWGPEGMKAKLDLLSQLVVTLPPLGMDSAIEPMTLSLNYYSGIGLAIGLSLLNTGYSVESAEVMGMTITSEDEGFPIRCLDTGYEYRLNPEVTVLPYLLSYEFMGKRNTLQYEDEGFVEGFKLALQLNGIDPEMVQILR